MCKNNSLVARVCSMQKVEQSLEDVDLPDQPENWSLNPATAEAVVPVSFGLLFFGHSALSEFLWHKINS